MSDSLFRAYLPLLLWPGLGLLLFRFLPEAVPRWLGRWLYWVGVPAEVFILIRQADLASDVGLTPLFVLLALALGFGLGWLGWLGLRPSQGDDRSLAGSVVLTAALGNTGFVGLAIAPALVDPTFLSWVVFYSITQNVLGSYGIGILVARHFGHTQAAYHPLRLLRDIALIPSLWAAVIGLSTRPVPLPESIESSLHYLLWLIIPSALALMGMRLSQLQSWHCLRLALLPVGIKIIAIPGLIGGIAWSLGLPSAAILALVLMAGMPSAFANLILAEEYDLNRDVMASSVALSTGLLIITIPFWLGLVHVLPPSPFSL